MDRMVGPDIHRPTLLCASFAALKLLTAGKADDAEDTLAEAFGNVIHRCKDQHGRLLAKIVIPIDCTDEELARAKAWALRVVESRLREENKPNASGLRTGGPSRDDSTQHRVVGRSESKED